MQRQENTPGFLQGTVHTVSRSLVGLAQGKDCTYIGSHNAALGSHEDQADEDGRAQHSHSTHERIRSLRLGPAPFGGSCPGDYTQESSEASDCSKDQTS